MFVKPIIIIGAPRSGTSLVQKIIRDHPAFVSLPKESDIIWNRYCHPSMKNWESEEFSGEDVTELMIAEIRQEFIAYSLSAQTWHKFDRLNIMRYKRYPLLSYFLRNGYNIFSLLRKQIISQNKPLRLVEKSISNPFRISFIDKVFPDAKYIYIKRDGRANINSLINGWREPNRFFSYKLPVELKIPGYNYERWKFILPFGWRNYIDKPLEEIVAFQWIAVHNAIEQEFVKPIYNNRLLAIKLEDLSVRPQETLHKISDFIEVPWTRYFEDLTTHLPVINSSHSDVNFNRWETENKAMIMRIEALIQETMTKMGY
ncbi:MAG TPA: sulfotransferase [Thiotrichaceae bacterium]|nr:sulfotransferase [Thiotrichaceae bacterium]